MIRKPAYFKALTSLALISFGLLGSTGANAIDNKDTGSIGIRISEIPSGVSDNPLARVYIIDRLQPLKVATQRIEVFNTSKAAINVSLYAGAAKFVNGEFIGLAGRASNDLTKWTTITPSQVLVKAGGSETAIVTISPPADAPSIQLYGVLWAEVRGTAKATGLSSVSRVGIRMYVPVGNSSEEEIGATTVTSSTNEIIVNTSSFTGVTKYVIYVSYFVAIVFLVMFFLYARRYFVARKAKRKKDKHEERQWMAEKRRRKIAARNLKASAEEDLEIDDAE